MRKTLSPGAVNSAMAQPALLVYLERECGNYLYSSGKSLFVFLTSADVSAAKLCDSEASYGLVPDNGEQVGDDGSASSFCNLPSYVSSSFRLAMEDFLASCAFAFSESPTTG